MRSKRLIATVVAAIMLTAILPMGIVSADSQTTILDETFNNAFVNHGLHRNWWGKVTQEPAWKEGKLWGTGWGGTGVYWDAEDGSLAIGAGYNDDGTAITSGGETSLSHAVLSDGLADGSSIILTYEFRTIDAAPKKSSGQAWFRFYSYDKDGTGHDVTPFALKISSEGVIPVWAITEYYPNGQKTVYGKDLDRDPSQISFDWGKDYTVQIELKPALEGADATRFVVNVWEDGRHIGTGIINEWPQVKPEYLKKPYQLAYNFPISHSLAPGGDREELLFLKRVAMDVIQPDVAVGASYFPEDGCVDAAIDTEVYADFESEIKPVDKSQVKVDGGASVKSVSMSDGNKRVNVELDGVKADTAYTISIDGVQGVNSQTAFDGYEWSFTTDSGVTVNKPYFGSSVSIIGEEDIDFSDVAGLTDKEYLDGEAWGTSTPDAVGSAVYADDTALFIAHKKTTGNVSRKFEPLADGEILNISGTVKNSYHTWAPPNQRFEDTFELVGSNGERLTLFGIKGNQYWWEFIVLHQGEIKAWDKTAGTQTDITVSGQGRFNGTYDWADLEENDTVFNLGDRPNIGKNYSYLEGEEEFTITVSPAKNGKYDIVLTFVGGNINASFTKTVDASFAKNLDEIKLVSYSSFEDTVGEMFKITGLNVSKTLGNPYPVAGKNTVHVPYTNISGNAFDTDILVVERDAETNAINKATIITKKDIEGESGVFDCEFTVTEAGSKLDIYALNNAEGMILLSDGNTFDVGE